MIEAVKISRPTPDFTRCGTASRLMRKAARRLMAIWRSKASSLVSPTGVEPETPALL